MHLIALVGFAGSGKDTAGTLLVEKYGFKSFSFAESLKDALASIFCWDRTLLEGHTGESRAWRETIDPWWAEKLGIPQFTPRWAMQNIGTNVMRQHFHPDVWIHNVERKLTLLPPNTNVVLTDGRFPNELGLGRQYGSKTVRVRRGPEPPWYDVALKANGYKPHPLEPAWPNNSAAYLARLRMRDEFEIHESEWAFIGEHIDETIENDDTLEHLYDEVKRVCL